MSERAIQKVTYLHFISSVIRLATLDLCLQHTNIKFNEVCKMLQDAFGKYLHSKLE
jgi:hypothetical protein